MKIKKGFVLREVCSERVIMGEGLGAINFGKLLALGTPEYIQNDPGVRTAYLGNRKRGEG